MKNTLLFWLASSIVCGAAAEAAVKDAVVSILTTDGKGQASLGTGTFVSSDGKILTCYHVIRGADTVEVLAGEKLYSDVELVSIAPSYDLAYLKVNGLHEPVSFLNTANLSPNTFASAALDTYAHPSIVPNQHLVVRPTSDSYQPSQGFRDPQTNSLLFGLRNVDLISVDMTIYNGVSGAPLLYHNSIVGVISGSFQEGGSIAWAIPVKYLTEMRQLGPDFPAANQWPELALMGKSWRSLRKQCNPGLKLTVALKQYGAHIDHFEALVHETLSPRSLAAYRQFLDVVNSEVAEKGGKMKVDEDPDFSKRLEATLGRDMIQQIMTIGEQFENEVDDDDDPVEDLEDELDDFFDSLPKTPKNVQLREKTFNQWDDIKNALEKLADGFPDMDDDDDETLGDLQRNMSKFFNLIGTVQQEMNVLLEGARNMATIVESVFEASPDLPAVVG